ncbi:MAG: PQQ-binding-like beta-propeller repeat protein [Bdellovibrionia bacterium]
MSEVSEKLEVVKAVVPTLVLPLAAVSLILNALATFIARFFGVELKWEGPKRLIEVLLKPKVILFATLFNLFIIFGYYGVQYCRGFPVPLWYIELTNQRAVQESVNPIPNRNYPDSVRVSNQIEHSPLYQAQKVNPLKQAWKTKLPRGVFGAVTLSGASVFVGSDDGNTYEIDQDSGQILRRFYSGTPVTPSPLVWKSRLFVGEGEHTSHHSRIYSFDLKTGQLLGAFQTKGHTEGTPFLAEYEGVTSLFVSAGSDGLYAVDPLTLQERWHRKLGHVDSEARVSESLVFIGTGVERGYWQKSHRAFALDFLTGKEQWNVNLTESNWMPPVFVGNEVCFGTGEIYSKSHVGQLSCFNQVTGKLAHNIASSAPIFGIPLQLENTVVISNLDSEVCAYKWPSADKIWCRKFQGGKSYASVTYDGKGNILYPTAQEGIFVLDRDTGKTLKFWAPQTTEGPWVKSYSKVVVGPDAWFIADSTGNVRKIF